ncbi:ATP-binding protein [Alteriqipengyuania sp. WL0013]|uniref:sensor histidine kinase n=1 Tax=Alteriqipengyuania sp. WL0013 TaxID=3110773 RepID=UPI002C65DC7B|nr:ATP-binding protein [Alteriqipengyuania sp. WL0013]MEB3416808.1 ATP-binding protein [Alteriqipengyuania sp. WL0013]
MPFSHLKGIDAPAFADNDELLMFVLDHGPNLVFIKDEQSRLVYANAAFLEVYPPDQRDGVLGTTTVESFEPEEAELFLSEDRRALREGLSEIVEEITDWKAKRRTLLTRKMVFHTKDGDKRLICIATDITDLAAREKRVVRQNAQLKVYSSSIAHDLRNPISSIISGLNIMQRDKTSQLGERSETILSALKESATGLAGMITSTLKAAASESADLSFQRYDLNLLLEEVRFNLSVAIEEAGLALHVTRLPEATVEPNLLRQLFQNLIENSIRHAGSQRPVVTIHHQEEDGEHLFFVGDNGRGIPKELRDTIFTQFFKGEDGGKLGLGLTICQRIANLHDGFIEVHDKVEDGCCMLVRIPAR